MNEFFRKTARRISQILGSVYTFIIVLCMVGVWMLSGPYFQYSSAWQLFINTLTTVITFIMVFIIQNTQNRDSKAIHLKLDELIHANKKARNMLVDLEEDPDQEIVSLEEEFKKIKNMPD